MTMKLQLNSMCRPTSKLAITIVLLVLLETQNLSSPRDLIDQVPYPRWKWKVIYQIRCRRFGHGCNWLCNPPEWSAGAAAWGQYIRGLCWTLEIPKEPLSVHLQRAEEEWSVLDRVWFMMLNYDRETHDNLVQLTQIQCQQKSEPGWRGCRIPPTLNWIRSWKTATIQDSIHCSILRDSCWNGTEQWIQSILQDGR